MRASHSHASVIATIVAGVAASIGATACGETIDDANANVPASGDGGADSSKGDGARSADANIDVIRREGFTPLECKNGRSPLAALSGTPAFDYLELRVEDGYQGATDEVIEKMGTLCATATNPAKCKSDVAAINRPVKLSCSVPYPCRVQYLVATRGDDVKTFVKGEAGLEKEFAPIGSVAEAAFLLSWTRPMQCAASTYRASGDGYDIAYSYETDPCVSGGPQAHHHDVLAHVSRDGTITTVEDIDTAVPRDPNVACPAARRAAGVRYDAPPAMRDVGDWLAAAAYLEAASVGSFARLARELASFGAPRALVLRVVEAARDERRHARAMRALAKKEGKHVARAPRVDGAPRSLEAVATENVVEGCTRETWGAVVAAYQARTAATPMMREVFASIAREEAEHAALAADVDRWLSTRLSGAALARVEAARDEAARMVERDELSIATLAAAARRELGLPSRAVATELFARTRSQLFAA